MQQLSKAEWVQDLKIVDGQERLPVIEEELHSLLWELQWVKYCLNMGCMWRVEAGETVKVGNRTFTKDLRIWNLYILREMLWSVLQIMARIQL